MPQCKPSWFILGQVRLGYCCHRSVVNDFNTLGLSLKKQYVGIPSKNANFALVVVDTENTAGLMLYPTWGVEARSPPEGYEWLTE